MNPLVVFLAREFSIYKLNIKKLENFFYFQLSNSGHLENGKLLIANNENNLKKIIFKKVERGNEEKKKLITDQVLNKILSKFKNIETFKNEINSIIEYENFYKINNSQDLEKLKINTLKIFELFSQFNVKGFKLASNANLIKDTNLFGNWTIKPDMHIISTVPLLKYDNKSLVNINRGKEKPKDFQDTVLKAIKDKNEDKFNSNQLSKKENLKMKVIFHAYDYCYDYNIKNDQKISPKDLDRFIFLFSTNNVIQKYLNNESDFFNEFRKKSKNFFKIKSYDRQKKIIKHLSF